MSCEIYDVWLSLRMMPGKPIYRKLFEVFENAYEVYRATPEELEANGLSEDIAHHFYNKDLSDVYPTLDFCIRNNISLLKMGDGEYPCRLAEIYDAPYLLYLRGKLPDIDSRIGISVVGMRDMSEYGMKTAYKISYELAAAGAVIISGMALGIDSVAAGAALDSKGDTVAVLGCGIDRVYPPQHKKLMDIISARGAVISEFPLGTPPNGSNFPIRNRVISALGLGTLVVEADLGSGALITARNALSQGRDIFAVPGNIGSPRSSGTNALIRDGARVVLSARDIINAYEFPWMNSADMTSLAAAETISDYRGGLYDRYGISAESGKTFDSEPISDKGIDGKLKIKYTKDKRDKSKISKDSANADVTIRPKSNLNERPEDEETDPKLALILKAMPKGEKVTIDRLMMLGISMGELMASLTKLEIRGKIASSPGGAYIKK